MLKMARLFKTYLVCILSAIAVCTLSAEGGLMPFRGAWIATVANIDWPSEAAIGDSATQQNEMTFLLDSLHSLGLNAIIFQLNYIDVS